MKIAVIMENMPHGVSGGRYYTWLVAHILCEMGHDVTLYADRTPQFYIDALKYYKRPKLHKTNLNTLDLKGYDVYLGAAFGGCIVAANIARRHGAWCANIIFDPQPIVDKMIPKKARGIYDRVPTAEFMQAMRDCTIISNSNYAIPTLQKWLRNDDVMAVTATVNEAAAKDAGTQKRRNIVSTISRWEGHKGILDAFHAVARLPGPPEFHIITSFGDGPRMKAEGSRRGVPVVIHAKVSEKDKFKILAQSRLFVYGSRYEGQGIPVLEAQLVKTPGVAYDFPVMKEMAGGWKLAKYKNNNDLADKAREVWEHPEAPPVTHDLEMLKRELGAIF
jgi:glycosyltransferase involved in cell wall biosynthesis